MQKPLEADPSDLDAKFNLNWLDETKDQLKPDEKRKTRISINNSNSSNNSRTAQHSNRIAAGSTAE